MGMKETAQVNPVVVTEIIETVDRDEMDFDRYFVKTDAVFELQTEYEFANREQPIDEGRMTKLDINTGQFARIDRLEVSENG